MIIDQINRIINGVRINSKKLTGTSHKKTEIKEKITLKATKLSNLTSNELKSVIRARLKVLDVADAEFEKKAVSTFVESAIIWEYGESAYNDPKVTSVIETIIKNIENDPKLKQKYHHLINTMIQ